MILGTSVLPCVKSKPRDERTPGGIAGRTKLYAVIRGMPLAGGGGRRRGKLLKSLCARDVKSYWEIYLPSTQKDSTIYEDYTMSQHVSVKYDVHWIRETAIPIKN